jgi:uncharacterized glyoxalase superfamily protein PhnB
VNDTGPILECAGQAWSRGRDLRLTTHSRTRTVDPLLYQMRGRVRGRSCSREEFPKAASGGVRSPDADNHAVPPVRRCVGGARFPLGCFRIRGEETDDVAGRRVGHAEMRFRGGEIHLCQPRLPSSPRSYGGTPVLLHVYVEDVDEHCARSRAAGAEIVDEPTDQEYGERRYHCLDPEAHSWYFAQPLRR